MEPCQNEIFITDLLRYNWDCNSALIKTMQEHKNMLSEKMIRFFSHILNSHHIWNCKIQGTPPVVDPWTTRQLSQMEKDDIENFSTSMKIIESYNVCQKITYSTSRGGPFSHSILDILFQVINHSTYHRGQLALEFRSSGIEPLLTDYIFYKMKTDDDSSPKYTNTNKK